MTHSNKKYLPRILMSLRLALSPSYALFWVRLWTEYDVIAFDAVCRTSHCKELKAADFRFYQQEHGWIRKVNHSPSRRSPQRGVIRHRTGEVRLHKFMLRFGEPTFSGETSFTIDRHHTLGEAFR